MGSSARTALKYTAGLIGLYLAVVYATGFGNDIKAGSGGGVNVIKALQGR